ncbi:hypothetical protein SRHO_G00228380 [Serrasalmus rhombeus]
MQTGGTETGAIEDPDLCLQPLTVIPHTDPDPQRGQTQSAVDGLCGGGLRPEERSGEMCVEMEDMPGVFIPGGAQWARCTR